MDENNGNYFVRFKTTNRNTTTKERYLALNTDEIQLIRFMVGEMSHRRRSKRILLSLLQNTITTAYASISQRHHLQDNQHGAQNWLLLLCLSLLRSRLNEYEIRQIKTALARVAPWGSESQSYLDSAEVVVSCDTLCATDESILLMHNANSFPLNLRVTILRQRAAQEQCIRLSASRIWNSASSRIVPIFATRSTAAFSMAAVSAADCS